MKWIWFLSFFICPGVFAAPAQVLIIRHAEKPPAGGDLSPLGWQRAYALVGYFQHSPAVTHFGTPAAIYAMDPKNSDEGLRPVETVTPLANALNLNLITTYSREDIQPLVAEIMNTPQYEGRMVLICWEHHMIQPIAEIFGVTNAPAWPGDVFDHVWELDFSGNQVVNFGNFSQLLLPGDH